MAKQNRGPTLAEAVSSGGELVPEWDEAEPSFGPEVGLPKDIQGEIIRNFLFITDNFARACQMVGILDPRMIDYLQERIPKRWLEAKEALSARPDIDLDVNKNPEIVIPMIGDALKYAQKAQETSERLFHGLEVKMTPKELKDLMLTWAGVWDRVIPMLDSGKVAPKATSDLGDMPKGVMITIRERMVELEVRRTAQELKTQDIEEAMEVEAEDVEPEKLEEGKP